MELTSRKTYAFTEIKVNEIETIIFESDKEDADKMVRDLLSVINNIIEYTGNDIEYYINESK